MKKYVKAINILALLLWTATTACSLLLPFEKARSLAEPAHVLIFLGFNLREVSVWGIGVVLAPMLFIWLLLCPLSSNPKVLLSFPLSIYMATSLPVSMLDLQTWAAANRMDLFSGPEWGWSLYIAFSVPALICTFAALHCQAQDTNKLALAEPMAL